MHRFSRKGEPPTAEECTLIATAVRDPANVWALIASRIGPAALCVVLDELGGEKVHVPSRDQFIRALWAPVRDGMIRDLLAQGMTMAEVAAAIGVGKSTVCRAFHVRDDAERAAAQPSRP